jgi:hypothetical protein
MMLRNIDLKFIACVLVLSNKGKGQESIPRSRIMYNASVVKICNAESGLARFKNKIIFFYFEKTL